MDYSTSENLQNPTCNVEENEEKDDAPGEVMKKRGRRSGSFRGRGRQRHPNRVPIRKRLKHIKTHRSKPQQPFLWVNTSQPEEKPSLAPFTDSHQLDSASHSGTDPTEAQKRTYPTIKVENALSHSDPLSVDDSVEERTTSTFRVQFAIPAEDFHDCSLPTCSNVYGDSTTTVPDEVQPSLSIQDSWSLYEEANKIPVPYELLLETRRKVEQFLQPQWKVVLFPNSIHVVLMSLPDNISVQRNIVFNTSGKVDLFVHRKPVSCDVFLKSASASVILSVPLSDATIEQFVHKIFQVVNLVSSLNVCCGFDDEKFRAGWNTCPSGEVDKNPYDECRFNETFRSFNCARLVKRHVRRCSECTKIKMHLKRRAASASAENPHPNTPNVYLTEEQKLNKLLEQQRELNNTKRQMSRDRENAS